MLPRIASLIAYSRVPLTHACALSGSTCVDGRPAACRCAARGGKLELPCLSYDLGRGDKASWRAQHLRCLAGPLPVSQRGKGREVWGRGRGSRRALKPEATGRTSFSRASFPLLLPPTPSAQPGAPRFPSSLFCSLAGTGAVHAQAAAGHEALLSYWAMGLQSFPRASSLRSGMRAGLAAARQALSVQQRGATRRVCSRLFLFFFF